MPHWRKLTHLALYAAAISAIYPALDALAADAKPTAGKPAEADAISQLDAALEEAKAFQYGKPDTSLKKIEEIVIAGVKGKPDDRQAIEMRLLTLLWPESKVTRDAREFACRQLVFIGGKDSVPMLSKWLGDKELSHMARYTLGRMESPDAGAALRQALTTSQGAQLIGLINTLGDRRDSEAIPALSKLAAGDGEQADAAIDALGKIGGPDAAASLEASRAHASAPRQALIDHAMLAAADRLLIGAKKTEASSLFEKLHASDRARPVRIAALRGLVASRGAEAAAVLLDAITGADPAIARSAIGFTREIKDAGLSKSLIEAFPKLSPDLQEVLVRALGDRADATSIAAIVQAIKSDNALVRVAALETLGTAGDASTVMTLATAATKPGDDQKAARESLIRLKGDNVLATIGLGVDSVSDPKVKAELVRAMAGRRELVSNERLFDLAKSDPEAGVRKEAILGLGTLVKSTELKSLVDLAVSPKDPADRAAVEESLATAFRRSGDTKQCTDLISAAIASATGEAKPALVRLYKPAASPEALAALKPLLKDADKPVADSAIRTLADWPEVTAADDLLGIVKSTDNKTHKILALKGYIRLAGEKTAVKPIEMYTAAASLTERPDEKRQILSGLGNLATADALTMAEKFLKDESVTAEAAQAILSIVSKSKDKAISATRAKEALSTVSAAAKDPKVKKQAEDALAALAKSTAEPVPKKN